MKYNKPKVTVNYYKEYNKISRPEGFDPNDNADELYKKAGASYVPPSELAARARHKEYVDVDDKVLQEWLKKNHPSMEYDAINETEKAALRDWLEKNTKCIKYIEEGNKKKFFWAEEEEKRNDNLLHPINLGPENILDLVVLMEQRARVSAMDGRFEDALKSLIECWKIAQHYTNPKMFLGHQVFGMLTKERTLDAALMILDCFKLDTNELQSWQQCWQKEFDEDKYQLGFKTQRLFCFDFIQRNFDYHPEGKGRLNKEKAKNFYCLCDHGIDPLRCCEDGPTSKELTAMVDYICEHYEKYGDETPWFWYYPEQKFQIEIDEWRSKYPIPNEFFPNPKPFWTYCHRLKAISEALITVLALLRYKENHGHYPKSLNALIGYLKRMPRDPFSGELLVYHWLVDEFELYSVGPDFKDDGGKRLQSGNPVSVTEKDNGDDVFWPPFRRFRENLKFYHQRSRPGP